MDALRAEGWVDDDGRLHEWDKWAGAAILGRYKDKARKSTELPRKIHGTSTEIPRSFQGKSAPRIDIDKKKNRTTKPSTPTSDDEGRAEDAKMLCSLLAALIADNGSKEPVVTPAWVTSAERMLRIDKRPIGEAEAVLRWSQKDDFWRSNILSMPTLRKNYDKMRLRSTPAPVDDGRRVFDAERDIYNAPTPMKGLM